MADASDDFLEKARSLTTGWASYAALGTFLLYFLGYLTLRFHFFSFGIFSGLALLDERYLFAGARFLVYLLGTVPILVMIALPLLGLAWLLLRVPPLQRASDRARAWCSEGNRLAVAGVVMAVVLIQFVMRQCFHFSNLLLREEMPEPGWLHGVLLDPTGSVQQLYFAGLVAGVALTAWIWRTISRPAAASQHSRVSRASRGWAALLGLLVALQFSLLPINFGILISDKELPRVEAEAEKRWLVWEGEERITFLVQGSDGRRALVTEPKSEVKRIEVRAAEPILRILFPGKP